MLKSLYPSVTKEHLKSVENALCPLKVPLPKSLQRQFKLICSDFYKAKLEQQPNWTGAFLNSLDFHYSNEKLKLIEINTNASGYMLSNLLEENTEAVSEYESLILNEGKNLFGKNLTIINIIDRNPSEEKMYPEFLMFKDFFARNNIKANVLKTEDIKADSKTPTYNRDTDFYLKDFPDLIHKTLLSPNPQDYKLIADKSAPVLTQNQMLSDDFKDLKASLLESVYFENSNKEDLWKKRKNFFFKPTSSFGSKGVYSGKSISKTKFSGLGDGYLAQELHPPGTIQIGSEPWKYDIRVFFCSESPLKVVARVYKGQLTNFSQKGGGFALIDWV